MVVTIRFLRNVCLIITSTCEELLQENNTRILYSRDFLDPFEKAALVLFGNIYIWYGNRLPKRKKRGRTFMTRVSRHWKQ